MIGIGERYRVYWQRDITTGVKHGICGRIEVAAFPCGTKQGHARDLVEADTTIESGNTGCAAKGNRLAAFIPLNSAHRPAAEYAIRHSAAAQEFLPSADGELINIADNEVLRYVLVANRLVTTQVEWILPRAALVQGCEEGQRCVCIGQGFRPCVGGHEIEAVMEATRQLRLQGVVCGLAQILQLSIRVEAEKLRERHQGLRLNVRTTCPARTREWNARIEEGIRNGIKQVRSH